MGRANIFGGARLEINNHWAAVLEQITMQLENVIVKSENVLSIAYDAAYECEPECPCDYIMTEYIECMMVQNEIHQQITILETEINVYREQERETVTLCPSYESLPYTPLGGSF